MNIYQRLTNVGVEHHHEKSMIKKVKIVNMICLLWYHAHLLTSVLAVAFREEYQVSLISYSVGFLCIIGCQFLNKKGYFEWAAFTLLAYSSLHYFMITCYIAPGRYVEFFYLVIPSASLMFFRKSWPSIIILILVLVLFHVPFLYFDFYDKDGVLFLPPLMIFLFLVILSIIFYFKRQNEKNEELLELEKQKAIQDKEIISTQNVELAELSDFKNKFFINISHELRTPLTLIDGFAEQLTNSDALVPMLAGQIRGQSSKMKQIVSDILDLSKMKTEKFELTFTKVDVHHLLTKIYHSFVPSFAQKGLMFHLKLTPQDIYINGDVLYLERVINNLLLNSLKYTVEGEVSLITEIEDGKLNISIKDTGIGIKEAELDKVFNEFYQVNNDINSSQGSGVGLSFAQKILKLSGSDLKLESTFGKGTVANMSFEILEIKQKSARDEQVETVIENPLEPEGRSEPIHNQTILVVEDHDVMREYLVGVLRDYKTISVSNGEEAIEVISKQSVDLVITDYMMPKMDGLQLLQKVKSAYSSIPVIMLTARADNEAKLDALRIGIDDYITKPFDTEELLLRIDYIFKNQQEKQQFNEVVPKEEKQNDFLESLKTVSYTHLTLPTIA